jgi:hypothetical protein
MESDNEKHTDLETNKTNTNKKRFLDALENHLGIVKDACIATGLSRTQFYKWKNDDPDFAAAVEEVEESVLDFVESKLLHNIRKGKEVSILFFLKTRGKKRGYSEKPEAEKDFKNTFSSFTLNIKRNND